MQGLIAAKVVSTDLILMVVTMLAFAMKLFFFFMERDKSKELNKNVGICKKGRIRRGKIEFADLSNLLIKARTVTFVLVTWQELNNKCNDNIIIIMRLYSVLNT